MDVLVYPSRLCGTLIAPPAKSTLHRALIAAAFADRPTRLCLQRQDGISDDIAATIRCLQALGAKIVVQRQEIYVQPAKETPRQPVLDCGESGSTLRFLLPVTAARCDAFRIHGRGRLLQRPLADLQAAMSEHGCVFHSDAGSLLVRGQLQGGDFSLPGAVTSQYVSGLLLAAPLFAAGCRIRLCSALESAGYVLLTCQVMQAFAVAVSSAPDRFIVQPGAYHSPSCFIVEGDWSNAAFWLAAAHLGHAVEVKGLTNASAQPDRVLPRLLPCLGKGAEIDVSACPDLLPVLAVLAACAEGETHFIRAARLRLKESDRLHGMACGLTALGVHVVETADALSVSGGQLHGGEVDGCGDHRLVMAWAVAALAADAPLRICGAEAVAKSYPAFWQDYQQLGGRCDVL